MKTLHFAISIAAPKDKAWDMMLNLDTYKIWTEPFTAGSYYEGSWDKGAKIHFLSPGGEGMASEIAENKPYEFVSIRHIGWVKDGVEDTESPNVKSWTPAYENYSFSEKDGNTLVTVDLDVEETFEKDMGDAWPKALEKLKEICEE